MESYLISTRKQQVYVDTLGKFKPECFRDDLIKNDLLCLFTVGNPTLHADHVPAPLAHRYPNSAKNNTSPPSQNRRPRQPDLNFLRKRPWSTTPSTSRVAAVPVASAIALTVEGQLWQPEDVKVTRALNRYGINVSFIFMVSASFFSSGNQHPQRDCDHHDILGKRNESQRDVAAAADTGT